MAQKYVLPRDAKRYEIRRLASYWERCLVWNFRKTSWISGFPYFIWFYLNKSTEIKTKGKKRWLNNILPTRKNNKSSTNSVCLCAFQVHCYHFKHTSCEINQMRALQMQKAEWLCLNIYAFSEVAGCFILDFCGNV